jgi:hypothetical protein
LWRLKNSANNLLSLPVGPFYAHGDPSTPRGKKKKWTQFTQQKQKANALDLFFPFSFTEGDN